MEIALNVIGWVLGLGSWLVMGTYAVRVGWGILTGRQ